MIWTDENVRRIVSDQAAQLLRDQHRSLVEAERRHIDLDKDWGMDSLQRMELAAYVNSFFCLFDTSAENYLLADSVLDHWVLKIRQARQENDENLVFFTSGSTGTPKRVRHSLEFLLREAHWLATLLSKPRRIVSMVPAHHMYGFLFTILLPEVWQVPLIRGSKVNHETLTEGTLVVGTPFNWQYIHQSLTGHAPVRCRGVSSAAPLPAGLFNELIRSGIELTEIYGSTETAGLAYRHFPEDPYTLFPYVDPGPDQQSVWLAGKPQPVALPDAIVWLPDRKINVLNRRDGAVSIAGVTIYPAHIQTVLAQSPFVEACDVFVKTLEGDAQLFCTIQLRTPGTAAQEACLRWIKERLTAPEVPRHLYFY